MPLDTSIYFQQQQVQPPDQLNKLAAIGQIQAGQNQNRLADYQIQQAQRTNDQENKLATLFQDPDVLNPDGSINRQSFYTKVAQSGLGAKIPAFQKQFSDADKAAADVDETRAKTKKTGFESANIALTQGRDLLNTVTDPAAGRQWLIAHYQNPDTAPIFNRLGPLDVALQRFDQQTATPEGFAKWRQGAMTNAEQLVKLTTPDANTVASNQTSRLNNQETNATSRANNNATVGATIRGQNMSDKRAQQQLEQGKVPSGYRQNPDGSLSAIPGGPAEKDKSLTETQGKATGFAARMQDANKILTKFEGKVSPTLVSAAGQDGVTGAISNTVAGMLQPDSQLYQQAQENWVTANLRLESGAAIPPAEKQQEVRKWFPQPGDTPAKIQQKADARKVAERSMLVQAGPGSKQVPGIVNGNGGGNSTAGVPDDISNLLDKYGK